MLKTFKLKLFFKKKNHKKAVAFTKETFLVIPTSHDKNFLF